MLRYIIPLPYFLRFGTAQTFDLQVPKGTAKLGFVNPLEIKFPPPPVTALHVDSEAQLEIGDLEAIRVFANSIVRAYRLVAKETFNSGAITQLPKHQFARFILYGEVDGKGNFVREPRFISYLERLELGVIEDQKYSEIRRLVESPNLILERVYDEILLDARGFFELENFRMAVLEAVIALEIVISSIIKRIADQKGITEDETENFMLDVGLTQNLKVVLKLLAPESLPNESIISACKGAITIRNAIVHKARRSVSLGEAQSAIDNIQAFIQHVEPMVRTH